MGAVAYGQLNRLTEIMSDNIEKLEQPADWETNITVHANHVSERPLPVATAANYVHLSAAFDQIQLILGTVDLNRIHEGVSSALKSKAPEISISVPAEASHRFIMTRDAFNLLRTKVNELASNLEKQETFRRAPMERK